ncbi:acyltransferase family protein [Microbacterium arborescens]|uniref:acyltransferase family protein n=1 Tax=Microbacterium arborescens TaxID=33883 RepID=UPI000DF7F99A|nr:acyltransferase family protein [Microbacterium arborescens]
MVRTPAVAADAIGSRRRYAKLRAYRADIDGLRAVAILLVVTYHIWFGRVSGGVDVFLMLSAFFLTRSFLRRVDTGRAGGTAARLAATFRRLLPAAAVTLLAVLLVVRAVYPATMWRDIWAQTWASLAYVQNWWLAADAVDYYARSEALSPLQHFWSLSVQGQAFVLWALLFAVCAVVIRRTRRSSTLVLGGVFGAVFVVSLTYSIVRTATAQQTAYFDTGARLWEFAAGSLLVVALPHVRLAPAAAAVVGWGGLSGLIATGVIFDVQGGFPGYLALWPILCAAAVVVSGATPTAWGPARILASRPFRFVGRDAYALYLVHWPILVTWMVLRDRTEIGLFGGAFLLVLSLACARVLTATVDEPMRVWRRGAPGLRAPLTVLAVASAAVIAPLTAWQAITTHQVRVATEAAVAANPGARALLTQDVVVRTTDAPLIPLPTQLDAEWVQLERECAGPFAAEDPLLTGTCFQTADAARSSDVIVVIGDSHAQQMTGALLPVAEEHGWGVVTLIRGGCAMGLAEPGFDPEMCGRWREAAIRHVESIRPDAVMTIVTRADPGEEDEQLRPGIVEFIERIDAAGIPLVAVRDNPRFEHDMFSCLLTADEPSDCAVPRSQSLAASNPALELPHEHLVHVDLTDWICPDDLCEPAIGNIAVFRDDNHLSASYARSLAPALSQQLGSGR